MSLLSNIISGIASAINSAVTGGSDSVSVGSPSISSNDAITTASINSGIDIAPPAISLTISTVDVSAPSISSVSTPTDSGVSSSSISGSPF